VGGTYLGMRYTVVPELGNGNILNLIAGNLKPSTPVLGGSQSTAVLNQMLSTVNVVRDRMDKMGSGAYYGTSRDNKTWITPFGAFGNQAASYNVPASGYSQNTEGIAFGADSDIENGWRVGLAGIIQNSNFNGINSSTADKVNVRSYQILGYARHSSESGGELNLIADLGDNLSRTSRHDEINNQNASASFAGKQALLSAEYGQHLLVDKHKVEPFARLDYGYVQFGNYAESGATTSNLIVNSQNSSSLVGSIGSKYQYDFANTSKLLAKLSVGYDYLAKPAQIVATDTNGSSFVTFGANQGKFLYQAGLGYQMNLDKGIKIRFNYDYLGRPGFNNNMGSLNVIIPLDGSK
jgi:outer membrane autotransporter protein